MENVGGKIQGKDEKKKKKITEAGGCGRKGKSIKVVKKGNGRKMKKRNKSRSE